jgi:hypothetical protein
MATNSVIRLGVLSVLLGMASQFAGCNRDASPRDFREVEIRPESATGSMPMDANHAFAGGAGASSSAMPAMAGGPAPEIAFDTPEGWMAEAGSGMRAATFKVAGKEATIVVLPNSKDGYASNVRRWLGQLGMDLPDDRLESFIQSRETFTTAQNLPGSVFDFTQLKDKDGGKGFMLAAMLEAGSQVIFVKLSGDANFLQQHKAAFISLSKSIRLQETDDGQDSGPGADAMASAGVSGPNRGGPSMQSSDPSFNRVSEGVARLTWKTPATWKSLPASGMRTGSFSVTQDGQSADGSIVQLSGPAGGVESNVRRWMEQVGMTQPDDAAMQRFLQSQRKIKTQDGHEGVLINLAAQLSGNLVQDNAILATIVHAPDETIFVKLTGPRALLLKNVDALAQLSSSLSLVK